MKIISWNLNGLHSCMSSGSFEIFYEIEPDIMCCQEIKTPAETEVMPGYNHYWCHSKIKDNYSGTLTMSDTDVVSVLYEFSCGDPELSAEGRVVTLELPKFYIINAYMPNSIHNLERKNYRLRWDEVFLEHILSLRELKPIIMCGDFNTTMSPIDTFENNRKQMWAEMGYPSEERSNLMTILEHGFVDAFRHLYPNKKNQFTYWSSRFHKRDINDGWRLDYFFVDDELVPYIKDVKHLTNVMGSDHCPVELDIDL